MLDVRRRLPDIRNVLAAHHTRRIPRPFLALIIVQPGDNLRGQRYMQGLAGLREEAE